MASYEPEKSSLDGAEHKDETTASSPERAYIEHDPARDKKLVRKVDRRLLPILGGLYSIALIDRVNISAAAISGMSEDLRLDVGSRYTIALVVFFPPYFLFELPSNIVLRKVGSANWLTFIAFAWGCVMIGQGFVTNYSALAGCRFLLGLFESGFFPGCAYLISCWYIRYEVQQRLAWFYLFSVLVGGFSSILAYGLIQMQGIGGVDGWQWIFIIEGLLTVVVAAAAWFIIIDFPDKAERKGFLSETESAAIKHRLDVDRGDADPDPLTWHKFFYYLGDFKLWAFALMFMSTVMPAYALAYFSPLIIRGMGYSAGITNLMSAPPVVFAVLVALVFSWLSDKYGKRWPAILTQALVCIVGLMMKAYSTNNYVRYIGLFFGQAGCQGNIPAILAYQSNNIRMQSKRSVGSALQIGFGAIGGILGSTVFLEEEAPYYLTGLWVTTGLQLLILTLLGLMSVYFIRMNKKVDAGTLKGPLENQPEFKFTL